MVREGLRELEKAEQRRLLEKRMYKGLTKAEEKQIPPAVLKRAKAWLRAELQSGLEQLERGESVDGEEFFSKWRSRLKGMARSQPRRTWVKLGA